MKRILIIATATFVLAAPAVAGPKVGAYQVGNDSFHLFYDDLDTNTAAGRAELLKRVRKVAVRLCNQPTRVEENECVESVITQIHKPEIVQALAERNATRLAAR